MRKLIIGKKKTEKAKSHSTGNTDDAARLQRLNLTLIRCNSDGNSNGISDAAESLTIAQSDSIAHIAITIAHSELNQQV